MTIDLRSDTVTKPTEAMLQAMNSANVGDDVFGEDPTINALQEKVASMFGKEAALFCPSGTMANQIAIKVQTQPGDEVICDETAHVYQYEGGGIAVNSGVSPKLLYGDRGRFTAEDVRKSINPQDIHKTHSSLVVIENTSNRGGGSIWDDVDIDAIADVCREHGISMHLDGARIFNVLTETGKTPKSIADQFDSISLCFSKGLGAPVGSILIGEEFFIERALRARKVMGGGMRQAGYLAAACIYALDHHIERLKDDHERAKVLEETLIKSNFVEDVMPVQTNIVVFRLKNDISNNTFLDILEQHGIKGIPFGPQMIRFVTHLDVTEEMIDKTCEVLRSLKL